MKVLILLYGHVKWILSFATGILKQKVHEFATEFLGHTTTNDLLNKIEVVTSMVNIKNLKHLSMDYPNVNLKFFDCFINEGESEHPCTQ